MEKPEQLLPEKYYHIYNKGINGADIFVDQKHYSHFLRLYEKYIDPIAETFAWCLMKNHFHFLVRIREEIMVPPYRKNIPSDFAWEINPVIASRSFSNLFNAYAQAFNKSANRTGSLFETPFKRKCVDSEEYLRSLVYYIHNNPVKHGFTEMMIDYPWSSYMSIISLKETRLSREKVLGWFDQCGNFRIYHEGKPDVVDIIPYLFD